MFQLLDKIRQKPEGTRRAIAGGITAIFMFFIGWIWLANVKTILNITPRIVQKSADNGGEKLVSPLEALKENFAALKNLPEALKSGNSQQLLTLPPLEVKPEEENPAKPETANKTNYQSISGAVKFLRETRDALGKGIKSNLASIAQAAKNAWKWAYDPLR